VDTSNKWLQAIRLEGGGQFSEAVILFLEDALTYLEKAEPARAALDCSCAADCMEKMGEVTCSRELYREAAYAYLNNAALTNLSIRESLWSMRVAYEHLLLANDNEAAKELYAILAPLSRRIDSFARAETSISTSEDRAAGLSEMVASPYPAASPKAVAAVKGFLQIRHVRPEEIQAKEQVALAVLISKVGSNSGEKNPTG
jgi:hypothetical protein